MKEIKQMLKELAVSQKETDMKFKETDLKFKETDKELNKLAEAQKKTEKIVSGIGINLGHTAEEYFYYAMEEKKQMGGVQYEDISLNLKGRNKKVEDEFDIVLLNGDSIAIVEVKHKVHPNIIEKLITQKRDNFRLLFPDYKDYKIYLGLAGFSIPKEVEELAQEKGVAILRQKGDVMEMLDDNLIAY